MTDHNRKMVAQQALADRIAAMGGHPTAGDTYQHHKGGLCAVVMVGIDEDTLTQRVGYFSETYQTYSFRTLDDWLAPVVTAGGAIRPRFTLHGGKSPGLA